MAAYDDLLDETLRRRGSRWQRDELFPSWESWVEDCEEGYRWTAFEYDAELAIRDLIEDVLDAPELSAFPQHSLLRERVAQIDERFRRLFHPSWRIPHVPAAWRHWWRMGILRRAGPEYAQYWRELGFDVEVIPS